MLHSSKRVPTSGRNGHAVTMSLRRYAQLPRIFKCLTSYTLSFLFHEGRVTFMYLYIATCIIIANITRPYVKLLLCMCDFAQAIWDGRRTMPVCCRCNGTRHCKNCAYVKAGH